MGFVEFYKAKDAHIWDEFRKGSSTAFEVIYERHISILANYGRRICADDEMVKDAIHDLFIDLWKSKSNLGPTDSIKYYLLKACRRNLTKKIVDAKKFNVHSGSDEIFNGAFEFSHEFNIIKEEMEEENLTNLKKSIAELPPRIKEALFLKFYNGLNYAEISNIMDVNQQSSYNMVFKGLQVLKEKMGINSTVISLILVLKIYFLKNIYFLE